MGVHRAQRFGDCWGHPEAVTIGWVGAVSEIVTGCA